MEEAELDRGRVGKLQALSAKALANPTVHSDQNDRFAVSNWDSSEAGPHGMRVGIS